MTEVQQIELEMLKSIISICESLSLKYYLVCGSALGAVKYGGFIPWDDDIDIGMPREDYEIFCEKAQGMLPTYYFLQTYKTDRMFPAIYAKVRDNRTTFIEKSVSELDINHGIYVDVFPLDGYPKERKEISRLEKKKRILKLLLISVYKMDERNSFKVKTLAVIEKTLGIHKKSNVIVKCLDDVIQKWAIKDSDIICNHGNWQGKLEYSPKWHYGEGVWSEFEGIRVRIPENYDEYLTQKYGDWRTDLPKEKQVGHHDYVILDPHKSYEDYAKRN